MSCSGSSFARSRRSCATASSRRRTTSSPCPGRRRSSSSRSITTGAPTSWGPATATSHFRSTTWRRRSPGSQRRGSSPRSRRTAFARAARCSASCSDPDGYRIELIEKSLAALLLYDSAISGNCYKVRLLLAHLGVPYERREVDVVDRSNRPELLGGLNPSLRVPTIVLDDGRAIGESGAILWYFGEGTRVRAGRSLRPRADAAVDVLRAVRPRARDRGRALLAALLGRAGRVRGPARGEDGRRATARSTRWSGISRAARVVRRARPTRSPTSRSTRTRTSRDEGGFELDRFPAVRAWLDRVAAVPGHVPIDA